jgi:hypothetical protein
MPKFHKLQRGICLALFSVAGAYSLYNPHVFKTAALALAGVVAYDIVCYFKGKVDVRDFGPELEQLKRQQSESAQHIKEMKDAVGISKLAATFSKKG